MTMKRLIILTFSLFIFTGSALKAQDSYITSESLPLAPSKPAVGAITSSFLGNGLFNLEYNLSFPMGEFKDFISKVGYRGWRFQFQGVINDHITVGGYTGWYGFYEKRPRTTYELENGAITGTIWTYYYSMPLHAVAQYYFLPESFVQPFIGLAMGVNYDVRELELGVYYVRDETWDFCFVPEIGAIIPFGQGSEWGAVIKGRYNYTAYPHYKMNSLQHIDLSFGLAYSY